MKYYEEISRLLTPESYFRIIVNSILFLVSVQLLLQLSGYSLRKRAHIRHPPGPKSFPIVGNAPQIPKDRQWLVWDEWRREYGDIVYFKILNTPNVVLSSYKSAKELLDRRGLLYSDRPRAVMAGELVGWNKGLGYTPGPPSPRFKEFRRLFSSFIGPRPCEGQELREAQQKENLKLLGKLLEDPNEFMEHARDSTSSLILFLSYGYQIEHGDPLQLVPIVENAMDGFSKASEPGWWVDSFPVLRYVPWLPFQRAVKVMHDDLERLYSVPFSFVKQNRAEGTAKRSFISSYLDERNGQETPEDEELINAAAASLYSGGAETTVSSFNSFVLAMTLYPDVQARAQAEIDAFISTLSSPRLPTIADRDKLPYVSALVKEVYRWNPSVPLGLPHLATQDDEYQGYFIEKGTIVWANIWSILHDETIFPEPSVFRPERYIDGESKLQGNVSPSEVASTAFGFGRRICPGLYLAENSIFLSVATMLYVFNISKALDENGIEITPDIHYDGFISHPRPFKSRIEPRFPELTDLVRKELEELSPLQ